VNKQTGQEASCVAVEGPPGSGKTTHCDALYISMSAVSETVALPELLIARYNCGESDRFHDLQSLHKERLAAGMLAGGFSVLMDRCRVSTVLMRITQTGIPFTLSGYRDIERRIFLDEPMSVSRLILMQADVDVCLGRRRTLLPHESRADIDEAFFRSLHDNYRRFSESASDIYPLTEILRQPSGSG
jgi:thymidylate kinase